MRHLRDHYDGGTVHRPGRKDGDPLGWSVCMHPEPSTGATAAGMVAELPGDGRRPAVAWCSLTTPCTSLFLPIAVPLDVPLPAPLATGTGQPDRASAWWRMKALGDAVMHDPVGRTPRVQAAWAARERQWLDRVARDRGATGRDLDGRVTEMLDQQEDLLVRLTSTGG